MKAWLKIGLIFLVIGIIGIIVFGFQAGDHTFDIFVYQDDYTLVEDSYTAEDFTKVFLSYDDQDITVLPSDDDTIKVEYYISNQLPVDVSTDGGTLSFVNHRDWWDFIYINFTPSTVKEFILYIPADYAVELEIEVASGRVSVSDLNAVSKLKITLASGNVDLSDLVVSQSVNAITASGYASFHNLEINGDFVSNVISGSIQVNTVTADSVNLSVTSGSISLSFVYSSDIDLTTVSGQISVGATTDFDETYLKMTTISGTYYIDGTKVITNSYHDSATNRLECETVSGDIKITFPS